MECNDIGVGVDTRRTNIHIAPRTLLELNPDKQYDDELVSFAYTPLLKADFEVTGNI